MDDHVRKAIAEIIENKKLAATRRRRAVLFAIAVLVMVVIALAVMARRR
jgi:hypothetical protein